MLFAQQIYAGTFYDQLCEFNFNWKKYMLRAPEGEARSFSSEKDYVQAHLESVLAILNSNPVTGLNKEQYDSRIRMIGLLEGYREAGRFPINYYRYERIPVFIDQDGTHCAVAYLLQQTGNEELAQRIAAAGNYAWVKDIHEAGLLEWQKTSGLSIEELKLIQGAYDSYMPNGFFLANKYEIPQKPGVMQVYFNNKYTGKPMAAKPENVWCKGEGENGVLNGAWIQNYAAGIPWIEGYYENGKRSGQWKEYYQGTGQLCRTENWRDDKLNGTRKRYDRSGKLIEEILFKDGNAITKTNYDLMQGLIYVRKPIDSTLLKTEVYSDKGALIAWGNETVYNPGNLLWFQNIELTALNSISIKSRDLSTNGLISSSDYSYRGIDLYGTPPLVEYKKQGTWTYYREYRKSNELVKKQGSMRGYLQYDYPHYGNELTLCIARFDDKKIIAGYDSVRVAYIDNTMQDMYGYSATDYTHIRVQYYPQTIAEMSFHPGFNNMYYPGQEETYPPVKCIGEYNRNGERVGTWKYFTENSELYKTETFLIARKDEEEEENKIVITKSK